MHIEVPRTVEITPCVLFFIDGLRYGIDKKNGGTRVTPSVLLKSFGCSRSHRRNLLFPVDSPQPYKHGTSVRRFREERAPGAWIITLVQVFVSCNLP